MKHYRHFLDAPRKELMAIIILFVTIFILILSRTMNVRNFVLELTVFVSIISLVAFVGIYVFFYFNSDRWSIRWIYSTGAAITITALLASSLFASLYYDMTFVSFLTFYASFAVVIGGLITVVVYFWLKLKYGHLELRSEKEEIQRFMKEVEAEKVTYCETCSVSENAEDTEENAEKAIKINDMHQKILCDLQELLETEHIYRQQDLTIDFVAKQLKTNSKYLSNAVNQNYQKNFTEYVNTWRVKEAMTMLKEQKESGKYAHLTIQTIAEEVGFKSRTSFYTAFKRLVGITPVEYQNTIVEE